MDREFLGWITPVGGISIPLGALRGIVPVMQRLLRASCGKWRKTRQDGPDLGRVDARPPSEQEEGCHAKTVQAHSGMAPAGGVAVHFLGVRVAACPKAINSPALADLAPGTTSWCQTSPRSAWRGKATSRARAGA